LNNIVAGLNVQHDCHHGECELTLTQIACVERRQSSTKSLELVHKDNNHYVINTAALSSQVWHWKAAQLQFLSPGPLCWINVMHDGLKKWCATIEKKEKKSQKKVPTTSAALIDPSLSHH